jgi:hypothetical protein
MNGKIYIELLYGNTNDPNCSNLGDRILHWGGVYKFVKKQNKLKNFDFLVPKDHWIENNILHLDNTTYVEQNYNTSDFVKLTQSDIENGQQLKEGQNYIIKSGLIIDSLNKESLCQIINLKLNPMQEKIRKIKSDKKLISLHIRKNYGIIGSTYSKINDSGYPDFTWKYYDTILKRIYDNYDADIYIGSDLPVQEVEKHISIPFYSRLDIIPKEKELEIYPKGNHEIKFVDANMADWLSFYYSDIILRTPYSSFSESALCASPFATEIDILEYDHVIFQKIEKLFQTNPEKKTII